MRVLALLLVAGSFWRCGPRVQALFSPERGKPGSIGVVPAPGPKNVVNSRIEPGLGFMGHLAWPRYTLGDSAVRMPAETVNLLRSNRKYRDLPHATNIPFSRMDSGLTVPSCEITGPIEWYCMRVRLAVLVSVCILLLVAGLASAINKTRKPTGRFCEFQGYIADKRDQFPPRLSRLPPPYMRIT